MTFPRVCRGVGCSTICHSGWYCRSCSGWSREDLEKGALSVPQIRLNEGVDPEADGIDARAYHHGARSRPAVGAESFPSGDGHRIAEEVAGWSTIRGYGRTTCARSAGVASLRDSSCAGPAGGSMASGTATLR